MAADAGPLGDVDEWGRSTRARARARRLYDPVYRRWFRTEWEHLERIPDDCGALLVANHAGAIPSDAPVIMHGIESELGRPVYTLGHRIFGRVPALHRAWSRLGGVIADPDTTVHLLTEGQLVLVFPEGTRGTRKHLDERYRLQPFGKGGFVRTAARAGVPLVPIAVVGSEETMPTITTLPRVARALRVPYVPVTVNMVVLGPLGLAVPFPAKLSLRVLEPVLVDQEPAGPEQAAQQAEVVRQRIQSALDEMLRRRRSVWRG